MEETKLKKKKGGCLTAIIALFAILVIFYLIGSNEMATTNDTKNSSTSNASNKSEPITETTTEIQEGYEYIESLKLNEANITEQIDMVKDEVELYTLYKSKLSPRYTNNTGFVIMFSEKNGSYSKLAIQFQYGGKDWVMYDEIIINADGSIITSIKVPFLDKKTEVIKGGVYEVYIISDDAYIYDLIEVAKSTKATIRYKGDTDLLDYEVTDDDRKAIRDMIDFYQLKTGVFLTDWK